MSLFAIKALIKPTIRNKMFGIVLMLSIIIILVISNLLFNGYLAKEATNETLEVYQPQLELAQIIEISLERAYANFGFFVLSKDRIYLDKYHENKKVAAENALLLKARAVKADEDDIDHVLKDIDEVSAIFKKIISLQDNLLENKPAFKLAGTTLEPRGQEISGILQIALQEQAELDFSSKDQLESMNSILSSWRRLRAEIRGFLAFRTKEVEQLLRNHFNNFSEKLDIVLEDEELDLVVADSFSNIKALLPEYEISLNNVIELHMSKEWRKDIVMMEKEIKPLIVDLTEDLDHVIDRNSTQVRNSKNEVLTLLDKNFDAGIIAVFIIILFSIFMFMFLIRAVIAPLNNAVVTMRGIADHGNLEHTLPVNTKDEYSDLGWAFNAFIEKIRNVVDLVISSSNNLVSESDHLSSVTNKSEQSAVRQEDEIRQVSETFQKLNDSIQVVQSNTTEAAEAANAANTHSKNGQNLVDETISSMKSLAGQVDTTHHKIEQLYDMSNKIGAVVKVIRGITDQTNLLALNAAIEAARAGEQGRGFAVVADEVRALSQDVQKETDSVDAQISELQNAVSETLKSMAISKEQTEVNVGMVSKAGEALRDIYTSVNIITEMNVSIADETHGQGEQSQQMLMKLTSIASLAGDAAGSARESSALSNEFKILAQQLEDMVNQFLLSKNGSVDDIEVNNISTDDVELF